MVMKKRAGIGGLILLIIIFVFLMGYENRDSGVMPEYRKSSMEDLQLIQKRGRDILWILSASRADMPVSERKIYLHDITLKVTETPGMILACRSGEYNIEKGLLRLSEGVRIETQDGHFQTESLRWDTKHNTIFTSAPVILRGKDLEIRGDGLSADITTGKVRINRNVKAIYYF